MFKAKAAFSGFSADDLTKAKEFYTNILGLKVDQDEMGLRLHLPEGGFVFVYPKTDHEPARFTVLSFVVPDIDEAVDSLVRDGVSFNRYDGFAQDKKGIARGRAQKIGPDIAWFNDPSGNILAVLEE
jgi:catechol 2,3-dioxygenase-like lactoylglutathione lyase family enzyme